MREKKRECVEGREREGVPGKNEKDFVRERKIIKTVASLEQKLIVPAVLGICNSISSRNKNLEFRGLLSAL